MKSLALLAIAACHSQPAARPPVVDEPPPPAPRHELPPLRDTTSAPRPAIDVSPWLPDLDAEARWPLGFNEHPVDEPSFDVAGALADPGVTWRELCARGVQFGHRGKDQDLVAYLKAWCTPDPRDALYQLGLLRHSSIRGIAQAIPADASRIVVGRVSADDAEGALMRAQLLDSDIVDLVAASYYEIGKIDEALAMDKLATDTERQRRDSSACHRLVRAISGTSGDVQAAFVARLHVLATPLPAPVGSKPAPRDPTCIALDGAVACSRGADSCTALAKGDTKLKALIAAYSRWPTGEAGFDAWYDVFGFACDAMPSNDAFALLVPALDLALATSRCNRNELNEIGWQLRNLGLDATKPHAADVSALAAQVDALAAMPHETCADELRKGRH